MSRTWVSAKLHGVRVTDASVRYHGSVTIGDDLMYAANIAPYEQVHVVNLSTGQRWVTYALPGKDGAFSLNGGGARLGVVGDECVVMTFRAATDYQPATVVFCDERNAITEITQYERT